LPSASSAAIASWIFASLFSLSLGPVRHLVTTLVFAENLVLLDIRRLGGRQHTSDLGFQFRRGAWRANYTPKLKKRTALLRKLKDVFRRYQSQPVDRVVQLINPMLRGWVNYFAVGHSSACFSFIKDWVEKKIRRHILRARKRKGFGWTRWSRSWLYETLKLFNSYRVRRLGTKVAPAG
jgi:hypothetical protein